MTDEPLTDGGPVDPPAFIEPDAICVQHFVTDYQRRTSEDILREAARWYRADTDSAARKDHS